jgi:hypothetical protein
MLRERLTRRVHARSICVCQVVKIHDSGAAGIARGLEEDVAGPLARFSCLRRTGGRLINAFGRQLRAASGVCPEAACQLPAPVPGPHHLLRLRRTRRPASGARVGITWSDCRH